MTNTNDFRRYSYRNDTSYLIGSFDISRGSQAPKIRPESAPERELKVHENKKVKSKSQIKAEQRIAFNKAVRIAVIAVVCLAANKRLHILRADDRHAVPERLELTRPVEGACAGFEDDRTSRDVADNGEELLAKHPALVDRAPAPIDPV